MILTIDEVNDLLDEMAEGFPAALFDGLNGGVNLLEESVPDEEFPEGELYILGEYCEDALRRTEEAIQMALDEVRQSRTRFRAASNEQMQQIRSGAAAALTEETAENGEK